MIRQGTSRHVWAALAVLAGVLAILGTDRTAAAKETVRVAHFSWPGYGFLHIVQEKGLAPDIDLDISIIEDPVQSFGLLASGQLDVVTSTIEFGPIAAAEEMPVKLLGLTNLGNGSDHIIVHPDIEEPADLKGRKVAVLEGGLSQIYMAIWLEQQGIKWDEVEMVNLIAGDAAAAMMSGDLAAAELWDPYGGQVLAELPGAREVSHSGEEYWLKEGLIADAMFVSDTFIEERRDVLVALTRARYAAVEWWRENPAEGNRIIAEAMQFTVDDVQSILGGENNPDDGTLYMYSLEESARFCGVAEGDPPFGQRNGQIVDHWALTNKWWVTFGLMTETVDPARGIDCSILKDALGG